MNTIKTFLHKQSFLIITIIFAVVYFPINFRMPANGLDPSWVMAIAYGFAKNLKFGENIVFTYGPLGSAYISAYRPEIFYWTFIFWILIFICFAIVIKSYLNKIFYLNKLSALLPILLIYSTDSFIFIIFFLTIISASTIGINWLNTLLITSIFGFIGLSKFTFFIGGFIAILPLAITCIVRQHGLIKQMLWLAYFITFIIGWKLLGQELNSIPAFFLNSWYVASGYSSMDIVGPKFEIIFGIIIILGLFLQITFRFLHQYKSSDLIGIKLITIIQTFALLFTSWLAFKQGFVRHDKHILDFISFSGTAIGIIFLAEPQIESKFTNKISYGIAIMWLLFCSEAISNHYPLSLWQNVHNRLVGKWNTLFNDGINISTINNKFFSALNSIKLKNPLPKIDGTVDITTSISRVLANNLNWKPRPVIQSYVTYTPELAALNAKHMTSTTTAPQHFFVEIGAIDGRIAMQEDPLLWPQLFANYKFASNNILGNVLHLQRNSTVYKFLKRDFTLIAKNNYWMLPSNIKYDFLTLSAQPNLSLLDKARSFIFKPRQIFIESILANGQKMQHKFILSLKDTPFIFSPLVKNIDDFISIRYTKKLSNLKRVVAFRFIDINKNTISSLDIPKIQTYKSINNLPAN